LADFEETNDRKKQDMTRADAIDRAHQHLHSGEFLAELDRRVAYRTESQNADRGDALRAYLEEELQPAFSQLDFSTRLVESPTGKGPYLVAEYCEKSSAPTILMYGHGDARTRIAATRCAPTSRKNCNRHSRSSISRQGWLNLRPARALIWSRSIVRIPRHPPF